ncbi:MAG: conjugal transfer protein TrbE [Brevundimonas sp.]
MRFLDEYRRRPAALADHLPWAALVAPGVVLNKDGSFLTALRFRGPDLESATEDELMAVRARLNNGLRRLGTGWCVHVEARRRPAAAYPESDFDLDVAWLVDAERRARFDTADPAWETDYRLGLTWLPPRDETRRMERWLFDGLARAGQDWRLALATFRREAHATFDLLVDALSELAWLDDGELLTWLHDCVSPQAFAVRPTESPMFLDAWLADADLAGGVAPRLGDRWLKVVSVRGLPSVTRPGLLDALSALPFDYRWTARWLGLDKPEAELEIVKLRKRWFAKRKGVGVLLREAITKEEVPLLDTDAAAKTEECDGALATLGGDVAAYGYLTLTVTVADPDEARASAKARAVEAALNAQGLVARIEDLNAVEAWLGSLPGEPYADVRRPLVSTLNLADLLPVSAVWAGPERDACLDGPPLATARTAGSTPFRLVLHVGDVGHAMVVGPTGAGKSALLAFLALQWFRYPDARVVFLDKGRSARAATLAACGAWYALEPGASFSLQPLRGIDQEVERAWASEWIAETVRLAGIDAVPRVREEIWIALSALAKAPVEQRTLTVFCALVQDKAVAAALEPLTLKGPHGALLDGAEQRGATSRFDTFELESLMATPSVVAPVLSALFHGLEQEFDGRPTLLVLDEAWLFLGETVFAARIREWLKTLRKKNVSVVFATQSLEDVAASSISASLIESCPTQIFLPNPRALEPQSAELYRGFGLNRRQLELIAYAPPKRAYYWRQPGGRRLFDLRLTGAALALCGASSPEDQTVIDTVLARTGLHRFAREFLKAKGVQNVDSVFDAFARPLAAEEATADPLGRPDGELACGRGAGPGADGRIRPAQSSRERPAGGPPAGEPGQRGPKPRRLAL